MGPKTGYGSPRDEILATPLHRPDIVILVLSRKQLIRIPSQRSSFSTSLQSAVCSQTRLQLSVRRAVSVVPPQPLPPPPSARAPSAVHYATRDSGAAGRREGRGCSAAVAALCVYQLGRRRSRIGALPRSRPARGGGRGRRRGERERGRMGKGGERREERREGGRPSKVRRSGHF